MGGRRARSLKEIVGSGLSSQTARFTRAVNEANVDAVTTTSAKLVAQSDKTGDFLFYVSRLADFVRRVVESGRDLDYGERVSLARKEWSRIKKREKIEDDPIVTNALVTAVAKAIAKVSK